MAGRTLEHEKSSDDIYGYLGCIDEFCFVAWRSSEDPGL